jgi:hypothetical protein
LASASTVNPKLVDIALQNCEPTAFERYAQTVFGAVMGPSFKPLGGHKDEGADGFIDGDLYVEEGKPTRFFQASKEISVGSKIKRTITRPHLADIKPADRQRGVMERRPCRSFRFDVKGRRGPYRTTYRVAWVGHGYQLLRLTLERK